MRSKQSDLPYTGSRMGYARMEDVMMKTTTQPSPITREDAWVRAHTKKSGEPSSLRVVEVMRNIQEMKASQSTQSSTSIKDDMLSQVLGPERLGRVRGMGFGVCPSELGCTKSTREISDLKKEMAAMRRHVSQLSKLVFKQKKYIDTLLISHATLEATHQEILSAKKKSKKKKKVYQRSESQDQMLDTGSKHDRIPQFTSGPQRGRNIPKGVKCKLLSWTPPEDVVAIGRWPTDDPDSMVHCVRLGDHTARVWVDEAKIPSAPLWRTCPGLQTIENAVGSSVAWPAECLVFGND